jgi:hypothetical protein
MKKICLFDVCVSVHHIWKWREIPTWCTNLFIILNNSTCFGHLYAHFQEYISCLLLYCVVLNTICSITQLTYSWRWAYRWPKHVDLFKIINIFVHQVGISRHFENMLLRCSWNVAFVASFPTSRIREENESYRMASSSCIMPTKS